MADQEVLNVEARETRGSQKAKHLRQSGKIPAVLYGHGKETVSLSIDAKELSLALRRNAKLVELKGAAAETAIFKKIQWDTFYSNVLHVDFARTDASEKVEVKLPLEIRGVAPGSKMGGTVDHLVRSLKIECPANAIPEALELSINELQLNETLTAGDIPLPAGASLVMDANTPVVACAEAAVEVEEEEVAAGADGAEPEVIGQKDEDGEGGDS